VLEKRKNCELIKPYCIYFADDDVDDVCEFE